MVPNDPKTEVVPPAEVPDDLPLPSDPTVIFLGGLFVLAMLAAAYVVSEIVLPLVFAIVLKLLLQPALRVLERLHVPRILAALLLILALFGMIIGLGTAISGPARTWAAKLPEGIPRLEERLNFLRAPINTLQLFLQQVENFGETGPSPNGAISERGASLLTIGFHLIEGETLTPMLLAKRFTLNPVLVIISLVFWFWMWGIPGGILSMPMLAITKIICDRLQPLAAFGHFLEG
jgi:predicted PurR-regulated permease PerM